MKVEIMNNERMLQIVFTRTCSGVLFCMLLLLNSVSAQTNYTPYTFTTISGLSSAGFKDDTNNNSRFADPCGIVADGSSNLYVADAMNNAIRMISPSGTNWVTTTIAGTGIPGTNDGPGNVAQFSHPQGIAIDTNGYVYVGDLYNGSIRKLVPTGSNWVVSTIATSLRAPAGLVLDSSGNIYVAEQQYNGIARIAQSGSNWVVSSFAGSMSGPPFGSGTNDGTGLGARFNMPSGICIASNGNLFVADTGNDAVRMITPSAVVITPIGAAGVSGSADGTNKNARFSGLFSITTDGAGNLYVPDYNNNTIRKITPVGTNWVVTTIAGIVKDAGSRDGTNNSALFSEAVGITADKAGNVYVSDSINNTIRRLSPNGTNWVVTTIAGLPGSTGTNDGVASAARYFLVGGIQPSGIATDASGNIYISDSGNDTIRMITTDGISHTIAGTPHVSGSSDGTNGSALFNYPNGIAVDPYTNIYVAEYYNFKVRKISPVGTNWVATSIASGLGRPLGVAVDASSNVYVTDDAFGYLYKISPSGTNWITTTFTITSQFHALAGIALDPQGNVYVSEENLNSLYKLVWNGTNWTTNLIDGAGALGSGGSADGINNAARFNGPAGIARDSAGNLYIADFYNCTIRRASPSGTNWVVTTLGGIGAPPKATFGSVGGTDGYGAAARFYEPGAVAVDATGNVYVSDTYNNAIRFGVSPPVIVLGNPSLSAGQVQIDFTLTLGTANSFHLLQADQPNGPWTTNSSAIFTTDVPGSSYHATVPVGGASEFYRIQTP